MGALRETWPQLVLSCLAVAVIIWIVFRVARFKSDYQPLAKVPASCGFELTEPFSTGDGQHLAAGLSGLVSPDQSGAPAGFVKVILPKVSPEFYLPANLYVQRNTVDLRGSYGGYDPDLAPHRIDTDSSGSVVAIPVGLLLVVMLIIFLVSR